MIARPRLSRRGRIGAIFASGAPVLLAYDVAFAPREFKGRDVAALAIGTCGSMLMLWGIHRWDGVRPSRMRMAGWAMLLFALELSWGIAPLWGIVGLGVLPILPAKFSRPDMTHERARRRFHGGELPQWGVTAATYEPVRTPRIVATTGLVDGWPAVIGGVAAIFVAITFPMIASVGLGGRCLAHNPKRPCPGDVASDVAFVLGITIASAIVALVLLSGTRWRKLFAVPRRQRWKRSWRRTIWVVIGVILGLVSLLTLDVGPMILAVCCAALVIPRRLARNARCVRLLDDGIEAQRWLRTSRYLAWNEIDAVTARTGYLVGETGSWVRLRGFDRSQDIVLTTRLPHFREVVRAIRVHTTTARTQPPGWVSGSEPSRPGGVLLIAPTRPIRGLVLQLVAATVSPLLWISAIRAFGPATTGALVLVAPLIVLLYVYVHRMSRR